MPRDQLPSGQAPAPAALHSVWRQGLADLALASAGSFAADEAERLRDLAALLEIAPAQQARALPRPDHARLEALLAVGAGTSAALTLLGCEAGGGRARGDEMAGGLSTSGPTSGPAPAGARPASAPTAIGYLLSCGASGQHIASVIFPGNAEELTASGDTAALALVGAVALALADLAEQADKAAFHPERRAQPRSVPN